MLNLCTDDDDDGADADDAGDDDAVLSYRLTPLAAYTRAQRWRQPRAFPSARADRRRDGMGWDEPAEAERPSRS